MGLSLRVTMMRLQSPESGNAHIDTVHHEDMFRKEGIKIIKRKKHAQSHQINL